MLLLVPFSYRVERRLETAVHIRGGEAEAVDRELAERYQSPYVHRVVLVIQGLPDPDSTSSIRALTFVTDTLRAEPGVSAVLSRLDWSDDLFLGKGGASRPLVCAWILSALLTASIGFWSYSITVMLVSLCAILLWMSFYSTVLHYALDAEDSPSFRLWAKPSAPFKATISPVGSIPSTANP